MITACSISLITYGNLRIARLISILEFINRVVFYLPGCSDHTNPSAGKSVIEHFTVNARLKLHKNNLGEVRAASLSPFTFRYQRVPQGAMERQFLEAGGCFFSVPPSCIPMLVIGLLCLRPKFTG